MDVIIGEADNADNNALKDLIDNLANMIGDGVVFFINRKDSSASLLCKSKSSKVNAGNLLKSVATNFAGKGGGSPTFAQGGIGAVDDLSSLKDFIEKEIQNIE